ncbi:hypothetical protein [Holdemanella biformis]|uniref:hypothetical protein n=1 Tax=Holdemanella biformis TaxID=1735 RepID=UPI002E790568|nr:hypothetical protein [Holdemanella biformis]
MRDLKKIYDDSYESMYKDNAKRYKFYNNLFEGVFIANKKFQTDISVAIDGNFGAPLAVIPVSNDV